MSRYPWRRDRLSGVGRRRSGPGTSWQGDFLGDRKGVDRAKRLLERTHYLVELGITEPVVEARFVARFALELADAFEAERSARQSIQEARDRCLEDPSAAPPTDRPGPTGSRPRDRGCE